MKIIISPAKKMRKKTYTITPTSLLFGNHAAEIAAKIQKYDVKDLQKAFKCSNKIAQDVYKMYQNFGIDTYPALFLYDGLQYKNIDVATLQKDEIDFLSKNLCIADSLYGLLRATDLISPYRLDFTAKFPFVNETYYKEQLKKIMTSPVVNLCSNEFAVLLPQDKTISVNFMQTLKGVTKSYSPYTKIERGRFVRYLAQKGDTSMTTLSSYSANGYVLDTKNSTDNNLVYKKQIDKL